MKKCSTCHLTKPKIEFGKNKNSKDGLKSQCRACRSDYQKNNKLHIRKYNTEYYKKNKEEIKTATKEYYIDNREIVLLRQKEYIKNNIVDRKAYYKNYKKERYNNDYTYAMRERLGSLIRAAINNGGYSKKSKTREILGCDFDVFCEYIESKFVNGMSWDNRDLWHIDHIFPLSLAKDEQHLIELNNYKNLQPLWAEDNIKKGNKLIGNANVQHNI